MRKRVNSSFLLEYYLLTKHSKPLFRFHSICVGKKDCLTERYKRSFNFELLQKIYINQWTIKSVNHGKTNK